MEKRERKKDLSTNMNHEAAMDNFLGKLGLYRKPIAKDGSCLFRAVAEKIFSCQAEHSRVRKECIDYMKRNKERFEAFVEGPFDHHLFNLRSQKEWAGQVEIQALSMMYKCDFLVYKDINSVPIQATENDCDKKIMLCYSNGNHYDSIYPFSHKNNLGLCQSIVFELLYGKVFPFLMAKDPETKVTSSTDQSDFSENTLINGYGSENTEENDEGWTTVKSKKQGKMSTKNQKNLEFHADQGPPLSPASSKWRWEVMRSIDPDGYRNIELEVWEETRKEQQQKDEAVAATFQLKKGDRCQVKHPFDEKFYLAFIDDVFEEKCKIWIPELKERTVMPFSRLKPREQNGNSGYRDLSGYYRKQENSQDNNAQRGIEEQKGGRRRRSRNRKGNVGDANERSPQEAPIPEDLSGRTRTERADKNRRRRNNNNIRTKEDRKENNQGENETGSQNQGSVEVSAFPALPKKDDQTTMEKTNADPDGNTDPATFWRKRREVEQMEKNLTNLKVESEFIDVVAESTSVQDSLLSEESENIKDGVEESHIQSVQDECLEETPQELESLPQELPSEITHEIAEEIPQEIISEIPQEIPNKQPSDIPQELPRGVIEVTEVKPRSSEKRVNWQDLQEKEDSCTLYSINHDIPNDYSSMNVNDKLQSNVQTISSVYMKSRPPLKETVINMGDEESIHDDQSYNSMNQGLFDPQRNYEILKNPARQEPQDEQVLPSAASSRYVQPENTAPENETTDEHVTLDRKASPMFQMTNQAVLDNEIPLVNNGHDEEGGSPTPSPDVSPHPITLASIQNEILSGNIAYSTDPDGKDLPKDMELLRFFYNIGINYICSGMNSVFPGGAPMSPVYPMMSPNAMYAMQQSYQNRAMMMPQNVYPQMQQPPRDENQQQQQQASPSEETRDGSDGPGYKPNVSLHQSPQYHTTHATMAAAQQQAMFNMNYGQMYATAGHRPLYTNYNMFPGQRYRYSPNKVGFSRQTGRKYNRYYRNDNQPNVKLHNIQSGYGSYSKEPNL